MNSLIVSLIYLVFLYSSAQALSCADNPCQLGGHFIPSNGYACYQKDTNNVICTCPGGLEENIPCRLCSRSNPLQNVCRNNNGKLLACLEDDSYGTSYVCLCMNGAGGTALTTDADCGTTVILIPRPTTTTAAGSAGSAVSSLCANGGVFFNNVCNCPSGYSGTYCTDRNDANLCEKIVCKNNGTCSVRTVNGVTQGLCLCRYGTYGDYCELIGTLGFCSSSSCLNGGTCQENVVGTTRHAYCRCSAGYSGAECDNRYFSCPDVGKFADPVMYQQGKYFECTDVGGIIRIEQKSCPRGLRFNANFQVCTYSVQK